MRGDRQPGRALGETATRGRSAGAPGQACDARFRGGASCRPMARPMTDHATTALRAQIRDKVAAAGTSFYWAMRLLPETRREAMYAIYAFCREVDDIADSDARAEDKRVGLDEWRLEIDAIFAGTS